MLSFVAAVVSVNVSLSRVVCSVKLEITVTCTVDPDEDTVVVVCDRFKPGVVIIGVMDEVPVCVCATAKERATR